MSLGSNVLSSYLIDGIQHVTAELTIEPDSPLIGRSIADVEQAHAIRVLAHAPNGRDANGPASATALLAAGDELVVHSPAAGLAALCALCPSRWRGHASECHPSGIRCRLSEGWSGRHVLVESTRIDHE